MLSKNRIFVRLLGTFYDNVANTPFVESIDSIYTNIIFTRLAEIVQQSIYSYDSSLPAVSRFGYIKATEIDVVNRKIKVYDTTHTEVNNIHYISCDYLQIDEFFKVIGGVVDSRVIDILSGYNIDFIPIIYIQSAGPYIFNGADIDFFSEAKDSDIDELTVSTAKMITENLIYSPHSRKEIERLVNISLGAIWCASDAEEVVSIDEEYIYTTKNRYTISPLNKGHICVMEGDVLNSGDLISRFAEVPASIEIEAVKNINLFLRTTPLSESNKSFLYRLSSAVAKNTIPLAIDISTLSYLSTKAINIVSSVFKNIEVGCIEFSSNAKREDTVRPFSLGGYVVQESVLGAIADKGAWFLQNWSNSSILGIEESSSMIIVESGEVRHDEELEIESIVSHEDIIHTTDKDDFYLVDPVIMGGTEQDDMSGRLESNEFGGVEDTGDIVSTFADFASVTDSDSLADIIVNLADTIRAQEGRGLTVYSSAVADVLIEDVGERVVSSSMKLTPVDLLRKDGALTTVEKSIIGDEGTLAYIERLDANISTIHSAIHTPSAETILASESTQKTATMLAADNTAPGDNSSNKFMIISRPLVITEDSMAIYSDNEIEE